MRKKLFTFLLALVTSVGLSWAWTSGDCTVTLDAGVVTVSGTGAMENYTYFTKTPWYSSRNSITSIIIEDGVTNVGDYAFMRCENLESVTIGNGVVTIGQKAFNECYTKFTSLTMGNSVVTIGNGAFMNNSALSTVTFPSTLQTIGEKAFYGCTRISSLTIPSSVTSIGDYAFGGCSLIAYIIAEPTTPPSTEESTFISIVTPSYIPLYVPNGSVADYTAAERWNTFNIQGYDPSIGPTIEPVPATPDQLSGAFTINGDGDQINFSKGNLQYVGSWQFAENQWNIIGNDQADDNRDLFGWGTGDAPNKVSTTLADYADYHEWGENMGDGWYTLSRDEWTYLFQDRTNAVNLYAPAKVNGVNGFVILPDEFTLPSGLSFTTGVTNYGTNFYANAAWRAMENAGAVFLPVDGYRYQGTSIKWVGQSGFYWSSTVASEGASAWSWLISSSYGGKREYYNLHYGMCVRLVKAASSTPVGPTYMDADFAIDFRTDPYTKVGGGDLPAGVLVEGSMNTSDAAHGYRLPVITIPVTAGNYKVMMGTCSYSNQDATVKTEDGSHTYATLATNNGTCYHNNTTANVVGAIFTVPSDQIIKVYGAEYTPFFSIEKMPEIPAFTDFEINFQTDPYNVISGAKPAGTVIIGTYHDNLHGYQNVEAVVPVEAGNYRLTVGACQYGTPGNVMSETNAELASFNSNLGEGNCYHNNTAANIVSTIFTVDMDQTITINGGAYMPYMKLEKLLDNTYYINFENAEGAIGTVPGEVAVAAGESWTIPANMTLYKEGYTFAGWSDGVNTYAPGDEFFPSAHGTLHAVYTANTVSVADASTINVKWYFGENAGAPSVTWQGTTGYLLAKGEVDGQMIDLKLDIDATSGKFHNAGRGDKWAQVNANTAFAFPSKEGAVVNVETNSGNETYVLGDGTLTCNTNDYYSYLEIVYPAPTTAVVIGDLNNAEEVTAFLNTYDGQTIGELIIDRPVLNNMYNTLCLPFDMNAAQIAASSLNGVEIREFTGASVEGTTLNLSVGDPVNAVVAGRPYFVKYSAASQLDNLHFEDVTINNALLDNMAVTFDGVTFKGTFTPFVMPNGLNFQGGYLFLGQNNQLFWPNTPNPLKPFRAYFYVNVESSTPGNAPKYRGMPARIVEGKNVATGVENAQSANQSTKVIVNGQLIIIKNDVRYNAQGQIVK